MSAAERLSENLIIGREAKLRGQMWNFEDSLSAKDNISRQTSEPEIVYLFYGSTINFHIARWQQILLTFIYFPQQHLRSAFLMSLTLDPTT